MHLILPLFDAFPAFDQLKAVVMLKQCIIVWCMTPISRMERENSASDPHSKTMPGLQKSAYSYFTIHYEMTFFGIFTLSLPGMHICVNFSTLQGFAGNERVNNDNVCARNFMKIGQKVEEFRDSK